MLTWLHENGYSWDESVFVYAIRLNSQEIIDYLHKCDAPYSKTYIGEAMADFRTWNLSYMKMMDDRRYGRK